MHFAIGCNSGKYNRCIFLLIVAASPRPLRRARLNSATTDVRTPTRATRASMARGETPEPVTPIALSAAKRAMRTPAKSARKQLVLKEEDIAELEKGLPKPRLSNERPKSVAESPKSANTSGCRSATPLNSEERRVTRSMSKTPPVVGSLVVNNIPQPQFDMDNSLEEKQKHVDKKEEKQIKLEVSDEKEREGADDVVEESVVEAKSTPKVDEVLSDIFLTSSSKKKSSNTPKVQIKVKDILLERKQAVKAATLKAQDLDMNAKSEQEMPETVTVHEPLAAEQAQQEKEETPKNVRRTTSKIPIPSSKQNDTTSTDKTKQVLPEPPSEEQNESTKAATEPENINEVETTVSSTEDDADAKQASPTATESAESKDTQILADVRLTDLTPRTISRVVEQLQPTSEGRKTVAFNSDSPIVEISKPRFPKTPARINASPAEIVNIKPDFNIKNETPVKSFLKGRRNSSTPLAKLDAPEPKEDEEGSLKPLPKIDLIGSLASLESKEKEQDVVVKKEISSNIVVSGSEEEGDSHEDQHDEDGEDEDEGANCMFVDNEVEVVENYQSGDSMDSSDRREIEENEIPHDGESVGSQDTDEEPSEDDEDEEKMSFIVSDDAVDEDGDSRNSSLRFSTAEEDDFIDNDGKGPKKRRRIVVHDSSDDSEFEDNINKKFKVSIEEDEQEHSESLQTSAKEDAVVEENENDKSNAENKMNKSIQLDTTASPKLKVVEDVHHVVASEEEDEVDLVPSSPEMSCDEKEISKNKSSNNKSIYEVFDSAEETEEESTKDNSLPPVEETKQPENESDAENSEKEDGNSKDVETIAEQEDKVVEPEVAEADSMAEPVKKQSKSSANESEAALLAELASCDLSHLKKMFNPLQKSRRQTLYVQGSEAAVTEPKPKASRRSEHLNIDFKPSQSFIETLEEKKRLQTKRTRISKSFCSAADDLNDSTMEEVQCKRSKKNDESLASPEEPIKPDLDLPQSAVVEKEETLQQVEPKAETKQQEQPKQLPKTAAEYLEYCDIILQAANEAKLKQKKQVSNLKFEVRFQMN